jgi:site-specific DNA recombinase
MRVTLDVCTCERKYRYLADVTTAIYLRMSMDRTGEELGIDRYREQCVRVCDRYGFGDRVEYVDNDVSASKTRGASSAYARLLADARAGRIAVVVVADLDRLTRIPREIEDWIDLGEAGTVRLITADGEVDTTTENGRMYLRIKAAVARHEVDRKSKRQRDAAAQAAGQGRRIGGRRPFGYDATGMVLERKEAAAVRWAYLAALGGVSLPGIARRWNEHGHVTPQAGFQHGCGGACAPNGRPRQCPRRTADRVSQWTAQGVRTVLLNPRNAGLRAHVTDEIRKRLPNPRRARLAAVVGTAKWPGIVDESTWRATVAKLTAPDRVMPAGAGVALLTGVALCGAVGCTATVHTGGASAHGSRGGYRSYRCSKALGHIARAAEPVEWFIGEIVIERMSRPDAARLLEADDRLDADAVRVELLALRTRRRNVLDLVEDGTYTAAEARSRVARLDPQIAAAEAKLTDAGRVDVLGALVGVADVRAAWQRLDVDRKRAVIDALVTVRLLPPGRGVRFGATPEQWEAKAERIATTIEIRWHGE